MKNISLTLYTGTKFVYENLHGTKKKVGEKMETVYIRIYPSTGWTSYGPRSVAVKPTLYFKTILLRTSDGFECWNKRYKNVM